MAMTNLKAIVKAFKKRINQLTARRKAATEEAEAAVQYAQQVHQENQQMKARLAAVRPRDIGLSMRAVLYLRNSKPNAL